MRKPDLNNMWEAWIRIGPANSLSYKMIQDTIRHKIGSTFPRLVNEGKICWFHFLIHPYPRDPNNVYFHVRFSPNTEADIALPEYCVSTQRANVGENIAGINKALLENEDIAQAWRIIGKQSEWIIDLLNIHRDDNGWIPIDQIIQFMHFFLVFCL